MAVDVSAVTYFAPLFAFFIVFLVVFAVLFKSKLVGDSKWVILFLSFLVASLFVSAGSVRLYVETIVPWFGALMVSLLFLMVLVGMSGIKPDKTGWIGWTFIIIAMGIFLISGLVVFSDSLGPYLPGSYSYVGTPFTDWLYSPAVFGGILLLALSAVVSWVLVKK